MLNTKKWTLLAASTAFLAVSSTVGAQGTPARFNTNIWYRLQTQFQGPGKALDVINDGVNNDRLHMVDVGPYSGQYWRLTPVQGFPGAYRISSLWQGENLPIDIINGGPNDNEPILAPFGSTNGQFWWMYEILPQAPGHYWMTTGFRGPNMALEGAAINGNQPRLDPRGLFSGQAWRFVPIISIDPARTTPFGTGCNAGSGNLTLTTNDPWVGERLTGAVRNLPADAPACELFFGLRLSAPLPIYQSPGCSLLVDPAVQVTLPAVNGTCTIDLPIPGDSNLVGGVLPIQALAIRPRGAAPRIPATNGVELKFGLR